MQKSIRDVDVARRENPPVTPGSESRSVSGRSARRLNGPIPDGTCQGSRNNKEESCAEKHSAINRLDGSEISVFVQGADGESLSACYAIVLVDVQGEALVRRRGYL